MEGLVELIPAMTEEQAEVLDEQEIRLPPNSPRFKRAPYSFRSRSGPRGRYTTWSYRRILAAVVENAGATPATIGELAEASRSTVYSNLARLRDEGCIRKQGAGWAATSKGVSHVATWAAQLHLSGIHNGTPTVKGSTVGGHSEIRTRGIGLQLEQCHRADRTMARWGVWPEIRKKIRYTQSPAAQLSAIRQVEDRADAVRNKAAYLTTLLLKPRPIGPANILDWTIQKSGGLPQEIAHALLIRMSEMPDRDEQWHLAHAVRRAAARRPDGITIGDVSGIQGWVRKQHERRYLQGVA